jgi:serine/threonine protein kinase
MALTPGTRFGAYQVTALLGAGGMGEVYRARDTKRFLMIPALSAESAPTQIHLVVNWLDECASA